MRLLKNVNKLPKKQIIYGLAIVLGICIIDGMIWKEHHQSQPVVSEVTLVRTTTVRLANAAQEYTYSGEVRGRYESQLAFQVGGKIIKRHVDLGSVVQAGDALMEIDPKDINQTVTANAAQVYSAQSQLKLAENNLNRYRQLYAQMTAAVAAIHPDSQQIAVIPLSAVYQTGDTPSVWVVQNDTVSLKPITVSQFGDNQVQVLNGLQNGDVVVTAGVHKLREGQKVRVTGDNL